MSIVSVANQSLQNATNSTLLAPIVESFASELFYAVLVLLIGIIIGMISGKILKKILFELNINKIIEKTSSVKFAADQLAATALSWIIYFFTIILVLNILGISAFVINSVSVFILILVFVMILLGIKDFVPNLIAGFVFQNKYQIGDQIETELAAGKITEIELLGVHVETTQGDSLFIPNAYFFKSYVRKKKRSHR